MASRKLVRTTARLNTACAGTSTADNQADAWIYVLKGPATRSLAAARGLIGHWLKPERVVWKSRARLAFLRKQRLPQRIASATASVGIGLRAPHFDDVLTATIGRVVGNPRRKLLAAASRYLEAIREHYLLRTLRRHVARLNEPLNRAHIEHVNTLIERRSQGWFRPFVLGFLRGRVFQRLAAVALYQGHVGPRC